MDLRAAPSSLALAGLLGLFSGCASETRGPVELGPDAIELRLLSYNLNYGLAGDPEGVAAIVEADTDLVVLQESTSGWQAALEADPAVVSAWPHRRFHDCCGAGGLAILSRWPIVELDILDPPDHVDAWFPAARAVVETPAGPVELLAVHLRPPVKTASQGWLSALASTPEVREAELRHYLPALDPALPTVVAGDFNEGDGGDALAVLREHGFVDVLAELGVRGPTWRWGAMRARLDHVAVDERVELVDAAILDRGRSDHLPLAVTVRVGG